MTGARRKVPAIYQQRSGIHNVLLGEYLRRSCPLPRESEGRRSVFALEKVTSLWRAVRAACSHVDGTQPRLLDNVCCHAYMVGRAGRRACHRSHRATGCFGGPVRSRATCPQRSAVSSAIDKSDRSACFSRSAGASSLRKRPAAATGSGVNDSGDVIRR